MTRSNVVPGTSLTTPWGLVSDMRIDAEYTNDDHESRDNDVYALAKYKWTIRILERSLLKGGKVIANIGCGAGTFTGMLANAGHTVYAYEPDPIPFSLAQSRLPAGCTIENKGVFEIEGAHLFDAIVMHDVLEHIEDDAGAVAKLSELLKPGGLLVVSVPAIQGLFGRHDEQLGHFRRYSRRSLSAVLGTCTEVSSVRYFGFLSIPIVWVFSKKLRREYPDVAGGGTSLAQRIYGAICNVEQMVWEPLGTALLAVARSPRH